MKIDKRLILIVTFPFWGGYYMFKMLFKMLWQQIEDWWEERNEI